MSITSDNLNLNLNLNLGATAADSRMGYGGPRYNTEDFPKLNPPNSPAAVALPTPYSSDWDPELRTWPYVREFIVNIVWSTPNDPVTSLRDNLHGQNSIFVPDFTAGTVKPLTTAELAKQVIAVLDASIDRADRALEIVDQATGQGALNYWTGMLRIDPSKDKNTFLLMLVARKIGEFVAMGLKDIYKMRRPAQVYPWIMPLIDGPDTPSFPSSHSLQAHLISRALTLALAAANGETAKALRHLADRIAYNREVAGVHYRMDSAAGAYVAGLCCTNLNAPPGGGLPGAVLFKQLVAAAKPELQNLP
jgi:hypothetical protein